MVQVPTFRSGSISRRFSHWERAFLNVEIGAGAGSDGRTGTEERVRVVGNGVSSVVGRSGERNRAGGMFTND